MINPDKLIEHNGYVYKLLNSKEEQKEIDKRNDEKRVRALGTFKQKVGSEVYNYLKENKKVLSYSTGGNYSVDVYFDFVNDLTWTSDEYSEGKKEHIGDTNWFDYDKTNFSNNFVPSAVQKMITDYLFSLIKNN